MLAIKLVHPEGVVSARMEERKTMEFNETKQTRNHGSIVILCHNLELSRSSIVSKHLDK